MNHSEKHHHKREQPVHKEMKLLAAPKETKFQTPESEKIDKFINDVTRKVSILEKQVSKQTFLVTQVLILVFGVFFSLGMVFVANGNQLFLSDQNSLPIYQTITKAPTSFNLDINNPEDNFLSFENTLVISGKTGSKATVIISTNTQDIVTEANNFGNFSQAINLDLGQNDIAINSFDSQGNTKAQALSVFYSEEKI